MDYTHIDKFLNKFKKILFKGELSTHTIALTITKHILSPVDSTSIKIKDATIYIKSSPMVHSEVLIHKEKILEDLAKLLPESYFKDIR